MFKTLKTRTLFLIFLILVANLLVGLMISQSLLTRFGEETGQDQLDRTGQMVESILKTQRVNLERQAHLIGILPIMATVIENLDRATILDSAQSYQTSLELDLLYAYDTEGQLLAHLGPQPPGDLLLSGMVHQVLDDGRVRVGYLSVDKHLHLVAATPVGLPEDPSGVLVIGQHTDQRFTNQVKRLARAEISILHGGQLHHSTRSQDQVTQLQTKVGSGGDIEGRLKRLDPDYFSRAYPIPGADGNQVAAIVVQISKGDIDQLIERMRRGLLFGGGLFVLLTLVLGLLYTRRALNAPLERMVSGIRQIRQTQDLSGRLPTTGPTELSQIGTAFNELISSQERLVADLQQSQATIAQRTAELERANVRMKAEIDERIRGEEQIQKLSLAVEQSPASILITDTEGLIEYVNPRFTALTGYHAAEAIGQNPRLLNSGQTKPEVFEQLWATITQGRVWAGEFINQKKNGDQFVESALVSPIFNEKNEITHYLAVKEDITERKRTETELIQAKVEAQAANRAKSEFLANMSHEIRTPMNAIMGMTSVVLESELDEEQNECLNIVYQSADSLLSIINDILDFSKIESGKLEIFPEEFSLNEELQKVADFFALKFSAQSLQFNLNLDPSLPRHLIGDSVRLRQILINLIGNALKFTKEGQIELKVGPAGEPGVVEFAVADTGIGIPQDRQEAIFESFAQASGSTTRRYGGTGLGLTISRRLVSLMGGQIWLESTENQGATFFFTLPLEPGENETPPEPTETAAPDMKGLKVLLAEDHAFNRQLVERFLVPAGVELTSAEDGEVALERLKVETYDLILLDLHMPNLGGLELARMIRSGKTSNTHTPIIALTANAFRETASRCRAAGIQDFLSKPFRRDELYQAIARLFP